MIREIFRQKQKCFIPFLVAGSPSFSITEAAIDVLVQEGADILELGVPFSDAMADGPVIQKASEQAAKQGVTLVQVLEFAAHIKKKHPQLELVLFSYLNPILKMGFEPFAKACARSQVAASLIVDLPPEEAQDYLSALKKQNVGTVFLASPTTSNERLRLIEDSSTEFVYYISRTGVTGAQSQLSATIESELENLRKQIQKPIAVGFGVSTASQARQLSPLCDAVVVGSAFVRIISTGEGLSEKSGLGAQPLEEVRRLARELNGAIRSSGPVVSG